MTATVAAILLTAWSLWNIICWLNGRRYRRQFLEWRSAEVSRDVRADKLPPAVIWAAVKGLSDQFESYLTRVLNQDYPDYRVVFAFESEDDPGHRALIARLSMDPPHTPGMKGTRIVIAGKATDQGQKVHNLLAAHREADGYGDVIAFVDSDALWTPETLRLLVQALDQDGVAISTGYRWLVPSGRNFGAILASVINSSISTLLGPPWRNGAWAGAMAIRRSTFNEHAIAQLWRGKVSDDCTMGTHLKAKGLTIAFCPGVTPVNWVNYDLHACVNFGRRQYIQLWNYDPLVWFYGFAATSSYVGGWFVCLAAIAYGCHWAIAPAAVVIFADIALGYERMRISSLLLPPEISRHLRRTHFCDTFLTPLWMTAHLLIMLSTAGVRHLTWGGIRYHMTREGTDVLGRGEDSVRSLH